MNTFLPHQDFHRTAACLDSKRLGKQRVEVLQVLRTLSGETNGWRNHPAVRMWGGYETALALYGVIVCDEWQSRGYKDTCRQRLVAYYDRRSGNDPWPVWMGMPKFHASHRSNLLRKMPEHYGKFGWKEGPDLPYFWPTPENLPKMPRTVFVLPKEGVDFKRFWGAVTREFDQEAR